VLVLRSNAGRGDAARWARQSNYPRLEVGHAERDTGKVVETWPRPAWLDRAGPGDILLLVDDDLTPAGPLWIQPLVRALRDPVVGAVGPTLIDGASGRSHLGLSNDDGEPGPIFEERTGLTPRTPRNVLGVSRACLATRMEDFVAVGGLIRGLGAGLGGLDYCPELDVCGLFSVLPPEGTPPPARWRPSRPEAITWHQQNWPRSCARDPFYREDALATRPANHVVTMKVANL